VVPKRNDRGEELITIAKPPVTEFVSATDLHIAVALATSIPWSTGVTRAIHSQKVFD